MPFLAFFKLIPIRDWLYIAVITGLLIAGGVWMHKHNVAEQAKGAAVVVQQDNVAAAKAVTQIAVGTKAAETTETTDAKTYDQTVAAPPVPDAGLVCRRAAPPAGRALPQAGAVVAPGTRDAGSDGGVGPPYDPSGASLTRGKLADAQIKYLQGRIHELEQQMRDSP